MTILSDRWQGFRTIPHVRLAELPTPVLPVESLSSRAGAEIWIKREDRTAARYGGNKVRKLEYILGEALSRQADTLITAGAAGSHHAVATALYGGEAGLRVHVVSMPQRYSAHAEEQLRALLGAGGHVHPVRGGASLIPMMTTLAARQKLRRRRPYIVPPGGSNVAGIIGQVEAGLELARQVEAGVAPEPDAIFVPLGSGGTVAGLSIGLAAAGLTSRLIAVRVVPRAVANRALLRSQIKRTVRHLCELDTRFPNVAEIARSHIEIDGSEFGGGYGEPTSVARNATRVAREHAGIALDPTYTSKTFSGLLRRARGELSGKRILFWHTLNGADLSTLVGAAPSLPKNLRRLLRR